MRAVVRKMGNSSGVILPKTVLAQLGAKVGDGLELEVEDGRLTVTPLVSTSRAGWADAAQAVGLAEEPLADWLDADGPEADPW